MPLKVLVAEEDAATLALMREVFAAHSVSVHMLDAQSVSVVDQEKFDGIFTDVVLSKLDGIQFIRQIRGSSWNRQTPVVILSKKGDTNTRMRAFDAGASFFLEKPVDRLVLTKLVKSTRGAMVEERRRAKRVPFTTEVSCMAGSAKLLGRSTNISREGMLFETDGSLKEGRPVRLSFRLEPQKPLVTARAVVVRVDDSKRAAVRFVAVGYEDGQRVREFVAKEVGAL